MGKSSWSQRIKLLLEQLRIGHAELAGFVGVDQATVWRWANGQGSPPSHVTQRVVEALEKIVNTKRIEDFFQAVRKYKVEPRSREMLEVIFQFSSERSFA